MDKGIFLPKISDYKCRVEKKKRGCVSLNLGSAYLLKKGEKL